MLSCFFENVFPTFYAHHQIYQPAGRPSQISYIADFRYIGDCHDGFCCRKTHQLDDRLARIRGRTPGAGLGDDTQLASIGNPAGSGRAGFEPDHDFPFCNRRFFREPFCHIVSFVWGWKDGLEIRPDHSFDPFVFLHCMLLDPGSHHIHATVCAPLLPAHGRPSGR